MLNSIIVASGAVVMGFGFGYFLVGFVWLLCGWWWKSLNVWRGAFVLLAIYVGLMLLTIGLGLFFNLYPDAQSQVQIPTVFGCIMTGFAAFAFVNKHRIASRRTSVPVSESE